jgi:hypothetical protein
MLKDPQCFGELICLHLQVEISERQSAGVLVSP